MSVLSSFSSAVRRSLATPQQTCQICARRQASKAARAKRRPKLEVELTNDVANLGVSGQRVQVAPGRMRNHLYPSKLALYVLNGRTMHLDGRLAAAPVPSASSSSSFSAVSQSSQVSKEAASASFINQAQIVEQLERLEPLRFERLTSGQDLLHGSVTTQNVLQVLQERGIQITELQGEWQGPRDNEGIEHGKVKRIGEYILNVQLQTTTYPIVVHVVKEGSTTDV